MSTGDCIQLWIALVLSLTLLAVVWYAWEARKQAKASFQLVDTGMRPILEQWIGSTPLNDPVLVLRYGNIGNGPAVDIEWQLVPSGLSRRRVAMGTNADQGEVSFELAALTPTAVVSTYRDANGKPWTSRLDLILRNGILENGTSSHSPG
jgi:hypothetical protein